VTFKNVQALRAIAVLLVILAHVHDFSDRLHASNVFERLQPLGAWGVDLFFVISGFIMVVVHWDDFERPGSTKRFLIKRIARIFPLYWLVTLVLFTALHEVPGLTHHWVSASANVPLSLFLIPQEHGSPLLFVGWTLIYEMYFYYIFSALLRLRRSFAFRALALWAVVVFALQFVPAIQNNPYTSVLFGNMVIEFILGAVVGATVMKRRYVRPYQPLVLGSLALAATFIFALHGGLATNEGPFRFLTVGIPMAAIVYGAVILEVKHRRVMTALQPLGDASYSTYLWHTIIFAALGRLLVDHFSGKLPAPILFVLVPALVVVISFLLYRIVEVPLSKWSRKIVRWIEVRSGSVDDLRGLKAGA